MRIVRAGLIGCGSVSRWYLDHLRGSDVVELAAAADRDARLARATGLPVVSLDELLADASIPLVLNLTPAAAHAEVTRAALEAGKHVWTEKPVAMTLAEAQELAALAEERGLKVAAASDTFLGAALQEARRLVDADEIGELVGASASFTTPGSEAWHPNPDHLFAAGPIYDEGVYFLTALVSLLGPLAAVSAANRTVRPGRTIATGRRAGETFGAPVPTHWVSLLEFAAGPLATMTMSFEALGTTSPALELFGTTGTLRLPFPGYYDGTLLLGRQHGGEWRTIDPGGELGLVRGLGVEDLARAVEEEREPRASAALALHVLDAMETLGRAAATGRREQLRTTAGRPAPLAQPSRR
jgi:predicted dehydrogenase